MNQTSTPFFSILIPVYNTGKLLPDCVGSIGKASDIPVEILIVDDGSTDDSFEVIQRLADADPRIFVFRHEKNRSLYEARRTGVRNSRGQYVLFLDSDDRLAEHALDRLHGELEEHPSDVLAFSYRTVPFGTVTRPQPGTGREKVSALLREQNAEMPTIWNKAYSGELVRRTYDRLHDGYVNMSEDAVQSVAIAFEAKSCGVLEGDPVYLYRYDTGISTSGGLSAGKLEAILSSRKTALQLIRDFLSEAAPDQLSETDGMEKDFLRQTIEEQIDVQMPEELRDAALLTLPQYFSNDLLEPHLRSMRTKFDRITKTNPWFVFAKKADNVTNTLLPEGTFRRKAAAVSMKLLLFLPRLIFSLIRKVYRIFRPHPDDLRRTQLEQNKPAE